MRRGLLPRRAAALASAGILVVTTLLAGCGAISSPKTDGERLDPDSGKLSEEYSDTIDDTAINSLNFDACQAFFGDEIKTLPEVTGAFSGTKDGETIEDSAKVTAVLTKIDSALDASPDDEMSGHLKKLRRPFAEASKAIAASSGDARIEASAIPSTMKSLLHDCVQAGY